MKIGSIVRCSSIVRWLACNVPPVAMMAVAAVLYFKLGGSERPRSGEVENQES